MNDRPFRRALREAMVPDSAGKASPCPDDNTIAAYLDGVLPPEQKAGFEQHTSTCPSCLAILGLAASTAAPSVAPEAGTRVSLHTPPRRWWIVRPAAALAILAIGAVGIAVLVFRGGTGPRLQQAPQVASVQPKSMAEPGEPSRPARERSIQEPAEPQAAAALHSTPPPPAVHESRRRPAPRAVPLLAESKGKAEADAASEESSPQGGASGAPRPASAPLAASQSETSAMRDTAVSAGSDRVRTAQLEKPGEVRAARIATPSATGRYEALMESGASPRAALRRLQGEGRAVAARETVGEIVFYRSGTYWIDGRCVDAGVAPIVELRPGADEIEAIFSELPGLAKLTKPGVRVVVRYREQNLLLPDAR